MVRLGDTSQPSLWHGIWRYEASAASQSVPLYYITHVHCSVRYPCCHGPIRTSRKAWNLLCTLRTNEVWRIAYGCRILYYPTLQCSAGHL